MSYNGLVSHAAFDTLSAAYALDTLDADEKSEFERHMKVCEVCRHEVRSHGELIGALAAGSRDDPGQDLREQVLDLALAPAGPIDPAVYTWVEVGPGIRLHTLHDDATRGVRRCLVWALPGAVNAKHRHHGAENILVLAGRLRDERGEYGPGEVCHSRAGDVHTEAVVGTEDCFCYVVYYGALEAVA